jgi:hypothetical protein
MSTPAPYYRATRHPWPCLLFVMALLAAYEGGVMWLARNGAAAPRAGVDGWLRTLLATQGWDVPWGPALLIIGLCLTWGWASWRDAAPEMLGTWVGMCLESAAFGMLLWGIGTVAYGALVEQMGMVVTAAPRTKPTTIALAIRSIGAGLYEETVFRLTLVPALVWLLGRVFGQGFAAAALAVALSAIIFAAAHHVGPHGERLHAPVFAYRALAGVYFALLFASRGFGIAVGTHACYNVLVGWETIG